MTVNPWAILAQVIVAVLIVAAAAGLQSLRLGTVDRVLAVATGLLFLVGWILIAALGTLRPQRHGDVRYQQLLRPRSASWTGRGEDHPIERFDKFTDRARKVLQLAQQEAQRFNHNYIGTEHLLLGLLRERDGIGSRVLVDMGIDLDKARTSVEFVIGRGEQTVRGEVGLTPRAKRVIKLAVEEARRLDHHYIGTEHLLLGLLAEGQGIAAGILTSHGLELPAVREAVEHRLQNGG